MERQEHRECCNPHMCQEQSKHSDEKSANGATWKTSDITKWKIALPASVMQSVINILAEWILRWRKWQRLHQDSVGNPADIVTACYHNEYNSCHNLPSENWKTAPFWKAKLELPVSFNVHTPIFTLCSLDIGLSMCINLNHWKALVDQGLSFCFVFTQQTDQKNGKNRLTYCFQRNVPQ